MKEKSAARARLEFAAVAGLPPPPCLALATVANPRCQRGGPQYKLLSLKSPAIFPLTRDAYATHGERNAAILELRGPMGRHCCPRPSGGLCHAKAAINANRRLSHRLRCQLIHHRRGRATNDLCSSRRSQGEQRRVDNHRRQG